MHLFRSRYDRIEPDTMVAATLGNFDGVHTGHQKILRAINAKRDTWRSEGLKAASLLVSFYPHPLAVIQKGRELPFISTLRQRIRWVGDCGVDYMLLIHFCASFATMKAEDFIDEYLLRRARVSHLVLGADARVGNGGKGTAAFIAERLAGAGRSVEVLPYHAYEGLRVSSGAIRNEIGAGHFERVTAMLGRCYRYEGRVKPGDRRGRTIGVPTLNLGPGAQLLPPRGVYATRTHLPDGAIYNSVSNVGLRPTFNGQDLRLESHLLDFPGGDLTGARIEVAFVQQLRDEIAFPGIEALKAQIAADIARAREVLGATR